MPRKFCDSANSCGKRKCKRSSTTCSSSSSSCSSPSTCSSSSSSYSQCSSSSSSTCDSEIDLCCVERPVDWSKADGGGRPKGHVGGLQALSKKPRGKLVYTLDTSNPTATGVCGESVSCSGKASCPTGSESFHLRSSCSSSSSSSCSRSSTRCSSSSSDSCEKNEKCCLGCKKPKCVDDWSEAVPDRKRGGKVGGLESCSKPRGRRCPTLDTDASAHGTGAASASCASGARVHAAAKGKGKAEPVAKGKTFTVTVESKGGHPNQHRILGTRGFAIDGKKGCVLNLCRGKTYYFNVKQAPNRDGTYEHLFYITRDAHGGSRGDAADNPNWSPARVAGTPAPTGSGLIAVTVGPSFPKYSYYQDANNRMLGNLIIVHDRIASR